MSQPVTGAETSADDNARLAGRFNPRPKTLARIVGQGHASVDGSPRED
jgi:hypothetical protein